MLPGQKSQGTNRRKVQVHFCSLSYLPSLKLQRQRQESEDWKHKNRFKYAIFKFLLLLHFFLFFYQPKLCSQRCVWAPVCIYISLLSHLGCVAGAQVVLCQPGAILIANLRLPYYRLDGTDVKEFPEVTLINQQQDRRKIPFLWVNRPSKGYFARQLGASVLHQLEWLSQRFGLLVVFPNSFLFTLVPYALIFSFCTFLPPLQHTLSWGRSAGVLWQTVDQSKLY